MWHCVVRMFIVCICMQEQITPAMKQCSWMGTCSSIEYVLCTCTYHVPKLVEVASKPLRTELGLNQL